MSERQTGGPAFPCDDIKRFDSQVGVSKLESSTGMTLRDYFSAKAMNGLLAAGGGVAHPPAIWAAMAYSIADAMLKERKV